MPHVKLDIRLCGGGERVHKLSHNALVLRTLMSAARKDETAEERSHRRRDRLTREPRLRAAAATVR